MQGGQRVHSDNTRRPDPDIERATGSTADRYRDPQPETSAPKSAVQRYTGRWIDHWDPEDKTLWEDGGRRTARRNLVLSIFAEFLGFGAWALWSIVVPQLPAAGFDLTVDQMFWLISVPSLVGATLRIPYTFAVPVFGGRNWTIVVRAAPAAADRRADPRRQRPDHAVPRAARRRRRSRASAAATSPRRWRTSPSSSPRRRRARPSGWNAAGGNIGTAAVQLAVPLVIVTGAGVALDRAGLIFIPFILLAAFLAWRWMDNLHRRPRRTRARSAWRSTNKHTWIISFIYIGTFGSFIGYCGRLPDAAQGPVPGGRDCRSRSWVRSSGRSPGRSAASSPTASAAWP